MSAMICKRCERLVDTDEEPESLYYDAGDCICKWCVKDTDKSSLD